jgi:hypothetical protein
MKHLTQDKRWTGPPLLLLLLLLLLSDHRNITAPPDTRYSAIDACKYAHSAMFRRCVHERAVGRAMGRLNGMLL